MQFQGFVISCAITLFFVKGSPLICQIETCGVALEKNIMGGEEVGAFRFPWFVALVAGDPQLIRRVFCGGFLIASRAVMTAAHCALHSTAPLETFAILGANNICKQHEFREHVPIAKRIIHPKYFESELFFDAAILILSFDSKFEPICLPKPTDHLKDRLEIIGFGTLNWTKSERACKLNHVWITPYSPETCTNVLRRSIYVPKEPENILCAGNLKGGEDACKGDSGGPLQGVDNQNRYTAYGVIAFGYGCGVKGFLGFYTDIRSILPWVYTALHQNECVKVQSDERE